MEQSFTKNDLIRYIYEETSTAESLAIQEALVEDCLLSEEYVELRQGLQQLPKVSFDPAPATIQNILRYSQRTALEAHH